MLRTGELSCDQAYTRCYSTLDGPWMEGRYNYLVVSHSYGTNKEENPKDLKNELEKQEKGS